MYSLDILKTYDWQEAFGYTYLKSKTIGATCSLDSIRTEDVSEIITYENGENDGDNWIMVFKTNDNRFGFLEAGCDYTGWDCQAGGHCIVSDNLNDLIKYGLTDDARARLNLRYE